MDKFTLVYEFNKESPLITYEASKELDNRNYEKAAELFEIAINKFPYHSTAYFLYAAALANLEKFDDAKNLILKGDSLLNKKKTFDYYSRLVENLRLKSLGIDTEINSNDTGNEYQHLENNNEDENSDFISDNVEESGIFENPDAKPIVTETLAEIYASQGNFKEALNIYTKLKELKPEYKEKFENRIQEINTAIENKKQNRFGNLE